MLTVVTFSYSPFCDLGPHDSQNSCQHVSWLCHEKEVRARDLPTHVSQFVRFSHAFVFVQKQREKPNRIAKQLLVFNFLVWKFLKSFIILVLNCYHNSRCENNWSRKMKMFTVHSMHVACLFLRKFNIKRNWIFLKFFKNFQFLLISNLRNNRQTSIEYQNGFEKFYRSWSKLFHFYKTNANGITLFLRMMQQLQHQSILNGEWQRIIEFYAGPFVAKWFYPLHNGKILLCFAKLPLLTQKWNVRNLFCEVMQKDMKNLHTVFSWYKHVSWPSR